MSVTSSDGPYSGSSPGSVGLVPSPLSQAGEFGSRIPDFLVLGPRPARSARCCRKPVLPPACPPIPSWPCFLCPSCCWPAGAAGGLLGWAWVFAHLLLLDYNLLLGGSQCFCYFITCSCQQQPATAIAQDRPLLLSENCYTHPVRLCDPMAYSPPGCSVHGISQARTLE